MVGNDRSGEHRTEKRDDEKKKWRVGEKGLR